MFPQIRFLAHFTLSNLGIWEYGKNFRRICEYGKCSHIASFGRIDVIFGLGHVLGAGECESDVSPDSIFGSITCIFLLCSICESGRNALKSRVLVGFT